MSLGNVGRMLGAGIENQPRGAASDVVLRDATRHRLCHRALRFCLALASTECRLIGLADYGAKVDLGHTASSGLTYAVEINASASMKH